MKKFFTSFFSLFMIGAATAQWSPTSFKGEKVRKEADIKAYYSLDISALRSKLALAQEAGSNAKAVEISLPTQNGKIEKFAVYSFPVMAKDLADKYQLGSYVGVGIDDPSKYLRFSLAPNDFQSMIIKGGEYEFIEPANSEKTVYGIHPKSKKNENGFLCSTQEDPAAVKQVDLLLKRGQSIANQPTNFAKSYDKKYRTLRLVMSTTGEYTQFFGGVAGALTQINATITRVNGVFEKDFAVHMNLLSYPGLIYPDPASDPYDSVTSASSPPATWNTTLRDVLAANVGQANYDIGHLFGASGGGGNAGCIGCVCLSPVGTGYDSVAGYGKGSGITSPATGSTLPSAANPPSGDNFDIDYVAHEMGHQLGANHTFAHTMQGNPVQMEPGSGSTIMGYAGITGATTDVQPHSDPYFHIGSIEQVQANLVAKTCDVETSITNNPPVIADLPTYNIPKGTAFVLTANVTDAENDPMTFTWEEIDNASVVINKTNLGTTTTGASFRSVAPSTTPTRYFPKLSSVLNGVLDNSGNTWESVSQVARTTNFAITARDNNAAANQQQTDYNVQTIIVGNDGPFKVTTLYANVSIPTAINWDVANTASAPYNVTNVKVDYTTDNGVTWNVLSASTPNDGTENFTFPSTLNGQIIKLRISSIGNVFYAIGKINVAAFAACDGSAVTGVTTSNITANSATVSWNPVLNATYVIRYRVVGTTTWQQTTSANPTLTLSGLSDATNYEVQVAAVCSGTPGAYSATTTFSTIGIPYCTAASTTAANLYISKVQVANINNTSAGATYSNFTTNPSLQVNLVKGTAYPMTINSNIAAYDFAMVFIDYNRNGTFESTERVLNFPVAAVSSFSGTFTVPTTGVVEGQTLRMRVILGYAGSTNVGLNAPATWVCGNNFNDGEVEDYNVVVTATPLSTNDVNGPKTNIQLYPNPASDILNITKVSDKASYKIYGATGQLVKQGNITAGQINVSELIKGGYVITIEEKGKDSFTSKFIKK
ncbi:M12 family metallo-peptidase [Chryseobacterium gambrini]|uniref:M12 family metallo-peptidase n=1 Tax=Chryseobacterium gambrini TaxID=373672 RepID=A0AAJ1R151_9FLAO|nr:MULTISPECIES: zinc-dependent metalloprotease family protein [Chryseobacterium]MDN4011831.1 M12 family metallo-peptidase [Chryseobacterium gambrini]MDN4029464.1 M12 family metallo-peptidase [Chryseobacterium gambrini]QWA40675.1 fibronectin type III domain-containing protein [Chryseobacterium sp. ZHDP1]